MPFWSRSDPAGWRDGARRLLHEGDPLGALRLAQRAASATGAVEDLLLVAAAGIEAEQFPAGLEAAVRAAGLAPAQADTHLALATVLYRLGRWADADAAAQGAIAVAASSAEAWSLRARTARRLGDDGASTGAFRTAHELDPDAHPLPHRVARAEFETIAGAAIDEVPERFLSSAGNLTFELESLPGDDEVKSGSDPDALGYYTGVTALEADVPARIVLFQLNHEDFSATRQALVQLVRETVLHELGHHYGMDEDELPF